MPRHFQKRQKKVRAERKVAFRGKEIFEAQSVRHLGWQRDERLGAASSSIVDTRLCVSAGKFSELTQAVWCCGVMSFKAKRILLQEVLQCLEWGLHVEVLSEAALQRLEKAERSFFKRICEWNGYPPATEPDGVPGGHPVSVTSRGICSSFSSIHCASACRTLG